MDDGKRSKITAEHKEEAERLKALWEDGRPRRTQAIFGEHYGLGNQANVGHYLNGRSALNVKAAVAFAAELGCKVADFSPRIADELERLGGAPLVKAIHAGDLAPIPPDGAPAIHVPLLANAGSMGPGNEVQHDDVMVGSIALSPEWVAKRIRPAGALRFIHAYGDSMSPTFEDGDVVLVDTGRTDTSGADGVYVLATSKRVFIKRVTERTEGGFDVTSDNPAVKTVGNLDGSQQIDVLGRVVWCWNGKKL